MRGDVGMRRGTGVFLRLGRVLPGRPVKSSATQESRERERRRVAFVRCASGVRGVRCEGHVRSGVGEVGAESRDVVL